MSHQANRAYVVEADDLVPILTPTVDILPRLKTLAAHFVSKYNVEPSFFARVPGRVNLIGEHIDYCGYAVCPMAIEQDILVAVALSKYNDIYLTNVDPKYKEFRCSFESVGIVYLCEVSPVALCMSLSNQTFMDLYEWDRNEITYLLSTRERQLSKHELATISARAERHIGTQGGGMDQAIAFLGKAELQYLIFPYYFLFIRKGSAKLINFNPLRAADVTLPENAVFVIAHSQAYHNKASTTDYNLRVAECRLAAQMIAKKRNKDWEHVQKLIDIQERLAFDLDEMVTVVMTDLHEQPYTLDEICESLDTDHERLKKTSLISSFNTSQTFKLQQRALHVFQEASRVLAFRRINEESDIIELEKLQHLGSLMSKSHASLHKLYECSHPSVDSLVERAMRCGAYGARLTGAGWGGCIVAIIDKNEVQQFVDALRTDLYENSTKDRAEFKDMVFPTAPNQGAVIYTVSTLF
ncbi:n-acetylgalactosamine kinase [Lasius niger]|uniref:N-acetylgalactosamine kinase n=1 Tax=Lasius niger TaxID=67767 RepID=A0A0J7KZG3_LASNI|nr:n-acetylgalactosamine kinase [Lasius niger]